MLVHYNEIDLSMVSVEMHEDHLCLLFQWNVMVQNCIFYVIHFEKFSNVSN